MEIVEGTSLRLGLRYLTSKRDWVWSEEAYHEDMSMRVAGESRNARIIRLCLPLINSINKDLVFTAEKPEDFPNKRLTTLDFELWQEEDGRTAQPQLLRSALSQHQKVSILANELVRRVSNTNHRSADRTLVTKVVDKFTEEFKFSEYSQSEIRDLVISGLIGLAGRER